jgi:hypothetical protein
MKKIIIILLVSLAGCSNQTTPELDVPMGSSLPSYVSLTAFNALQAQVASLTAQVTALQKQVNTNQSQMYDGFHEFYIRTDKLDSLRIASNSDTLGVDPKIGRIIQLRQHYQLITTP